MLYLQASLDEPLVQCAMRIAGPNRPSQSRSSEPRGQPGNVGLPADPFELGSDTAYLVLTQQRTPAREVMIRTTKPLARQGVSRARPA